MVVGVTWSLVEALVQPSEQGSEHAYSHSSKPCVHKHMSCTIGTPLRLFIPRHRRFQGHDHSNSPVSIHLSLDLKGEPTDVPLLLLQGEHSEFCGYRVCLFVFFLKGLCSLQTAPTIWGSSISLAGSHSASIYTTP